MDKVKLNSFLDHICQKIGGQWVLTGGSLALLEFKSARATEDIDLINVQHELASIPLKTVLVLEAKSFGLSPDQVNSSAEFFLRQCAGWEKHLVLIRQGAKGKIFRPDLSLFLALKLNRGTAIDIEDCRLAAEGHSTEFDEEIFNEWTNDHAKKAFATYRAQWKL